MPLRLLFWLRPWVHWVCWLGESSLAISSILKWGLTLIQSCSGSILPRRRTQHRRPRGLRKLFAWLNSASTTRPSWQRNTHHRRSTGPCYSTSYVPLPPSPPQTPSAKYTDIGGWSILDLPPLRNPLHPLRHKPARTTQRPHKPRHLHEHLFTRRFCIRHERKSVRHSRQINLRGEQSVHACVDVCVFGGASGYDVDSDALFE